MPARAILLPAVLLVLVFPQGLQGQALGNLRSAAIPPDADTVVVDSLSIVPGTFFLVTGGHIVTDSAWYDLDFASARFVWKAGADSVRRAGGDGVMAIYRVFPILFSEKVRRRSAGIIREKYGGLYNPAEYAEKETGRGGVLRIDGLSKTGSISRGVRFGNSQDVVVNSSLNLQMSGRLQDDVEILAAITDNNIPVQPEGNTQQLNEFDKVFIQLSKNKSKLIAGDFDLTRPDSHFMNFSKKGQGGWFTTAVPVGPGADTGRATMHVTASGAVSKGKYARNVINGVEANQGPYKLRGAENEAYIVILSGSEKVYIDGVLMTRGQEYDYVIDYNIAELTFTTKRLITRDKRIVIEFQYSEKNYARSLLFANTGYETGNLRVDLNVYSEQDSKNQPLLQDLTDEQKSFLASVGDSIGNAYYANIDSVAFQPDEVLYARIDSAGFVFFRYSTDSSLAHYRLGFTQVGSGKGNYVQVTSSANGRVFEWRAPVASDPQGDYEPVTLLITPRQQQMVTAGASWTPRPDSKITVEGAFSNYNVNLYAKTGKADDKGYAFNTTFIRTFRLDTLGAEGWQLQTGLRYEHVNRRFVPIETFRNIEFNRDWNLAGADAGADEHAGSVSFDLRKGSRHRLQYALKSFLRGSRYRGFANTLAGHTAFRTYRLSADGSYLVTRGDLSRSDFLRGQADFSKTIGGKLTAGIRGMTEHNSLRDPSADTLLGGSFFNYTQAAYLANTDTSRIRFRTEYSRRYDYAARFNTFTVATVADDASAVVEWTPGPRSRLALTGTYRTLDVRDTTLAAQASDENLLNRVEYSQTAWKGAIVYSAFYEAGTGQELKREFSYVKVTDGTGVYAWKDYNNDGIPQLNEFETAAFKDEANYIRVFLPVNEFVKSRFNQISQSLGLNPSAASARTTRAGRILSRFAGQFSMRLNNKTTRDDLGASLNPFDSRLDDSLLVALASAYRNTVYFNRADPHFGMDFTLEENRSKTLLTNGFETRLLEKENMNIRWNVTPAVTVQEAGERGDKESLSDYFSVRDFRIRYYSTETKVHYQPGTLWRLTLLYLYKTKHNRAGEGDERGMQHKGGLEVRYSSVRKGILSLAFNVIRNRYNAETNSPLAYEMLEGLSAGTNYTWNVSLLRNLSGNVQMSLTYDGRKPEGSGPVHTGGVEVRAFF